MTIHPALVDYVLSHQSSLIQTDMMKELFMIPERMEGEYLGENGFDILFSITSYSPLYEGKLFIYDNLFYAIKTFTRIDNRNSDLMTHRVIGEKTGIPYNPKETLPLCTAQDEVTLSPGIIENYPDGPPLSTTIGRFIGNYLLLVYPFGQVIPYINEEFTASKLEKAISLPLLKEEISVEDVKNRYVNTLSLFGQATEIMAPNISEKTITIPPHIKALRTKLLQDNAEALKAGDASVMSDVEKQLISAYKEYLKGDPSLHFLLKSKYFNVTLKKLFLVQGMTEVFGSPGTFTFIDNPMGEGWRIKDLPTINNEVRAGSYARAIETADGGVIAKSILRVFQDTSITILDCETQRGEHVDATLENLKDYVWSYTIENDGSNRLITEDNLSDFVGKDRVIRTPGYCQSKEGYCGKCFGYLFETLGQKAFAPVANNLARNFTTLSLKSMHGKSHTTVSLDDLNRYLVK